MSHYILKPLEDYITALNPAMINPFPLPDDKIRELAGKSVKLRHEIQNTLQDLIFRGSDQDATVSLIRKSHHSLIILINRAYDMRHNEQARRGNLTKTLDELLQSLEQLRHWFHAHYDKHLDDAELVPKTVLSESRAIIIGSLDVVRGILEEAGNHQAAIEVVTSALEDFVNRIERGEQITKHEDQYHRALIADIRKNMGRSPIISACPSLHELLVYWNLNSKNSISYFTKGFEQELKKYPTSHEQMEYLHLQHKYILQMPELPSFTYDPRYPSIKQYFCDYIINEIEYLKHKLNSFAPRNEQQSLEQPSVGKVRFNWSGDQLSLILRAAKDLNILDSRSVSEVFKNLVPYLSTEVKEELSADATRRRAYSPEARDKRIVVDALREMADLIANEY